MTHVPVTTRETRPSRLFTSTGVDVKRSATTILRIYATYEPLKVLLILGSLLLSRRTFAGASLRLLLWLGEIRGHIQSAILPCSCLFWDSSRFSGG